MMEINNGNDYDKRKNLIEKKVNVKTFRFRF